MTRYRLFPLLAVSAVVLAIYLVPTVNSSSTKKQEAIIEDKLAVQRALIEGESLLVKGDPAKAIEVLEAELTRIDGNRRYLMLLRDAYKAQVTNLFLNRKPDLAKKFLRRLRILDPKAATDLSLRPESGLTTAASATRIKKPAVANAGSSRLKQQTTPVPAVPPAPAAPPSPPPKVRANIDEDPPDPFAAENALDGGDRLASSRRAQQLLERAEENFRHRHFEKARHYYGQAYLSNRAIVKDCTDRWAYCMLNHAVNELNQKSVNAGALTQLENEVKSALSISPRLSSIGNPLLEHIQKRRQNAASPQQKLPAQSRPAVNVKHHPGSSKGWKVAESMYFRVFHKRTGNYADQVAQIAERTRAAMFDKWFGTSAKSWRRKCDIYLYETGKEYSDATGVSPRSPGHSRIELDGNTGGVVSLRIDLHCDNPDMMNAVLPHETTHVVLAGQFGKTVVPRWVDEGIAVLSEPDEKIDVHHRNVTRFAGEGGLLQIGELMQMNEYPRANRITVFYAQSVSLVGFLSRQRGPRVFTEFVRDGLLKGYEVALRTHYGYRDFSELNTRWSEYALRGDTTRNGVAAR